MVNSECGTVERAEGGRRGRGWVALGAAWPGGAFVLFWTLAAHIRLGLGRWPRHISDNPDSPWFDFHCVLANLWMLAGIVVVPAFAVASLAVLVTREGSPGVKRGARAYWGCMVAFGLSFFAAPDAYLMWLKD